MTPRAINITFLAVLAGVPLLQAGLELGRGQRPQVLELIGPIREARLRQFEDELRRVSFVHEEVTPWYQYALLRVLGRGNEKAIVGVQGWLHYSEDLDYLTGPPIPSNSAAVDCIVDLRDQLEARGVELLLVPVPPKTCAVSGTLTGSSRAPDWVDNPGAEVFRAALDANGVEHIRVDRLLREDADAPFLSRDTHWTPVAMRRVAAGITSWVQSHLGREPRELKPFPPLPESAPGDLVGMLRLPSAVHEYEDVSILLPPVPRRWGEFSATAEVILLGDSFTRVFSDGELGFGEGSGLAEVVAQLLGEPVDRIAISGGGARVVRETLARRSGQSADAGGLVGKRCVVWQFSMRDLVGDAELWKTLQLAAEGAAAGVPDFPVNTVLNMRARLTETSAVPEDFDYEFALGVYEFEVLESDTGPAPGEAIWVTVPIVRNWRPTPAAGLVPGIDFRLTLEPVERHYDLEETAWMDQTEAPVRATLWFPTRLEPAD